MSVSLKSFRADMLRAFPDVPALARLPVLSEQTENLLMSGLAQAWDASSIPKTHTVPLSVRMRKTIIEPLVQPARAIQKVVRQYALEYASQKIPAGVGADGDAGGGQPPEFTVREAKEDPYSAPFRYSLEIYDDLAAIQQLHSVGPLMQTYFTGDFEKSPVRNYQESHERALRFLENYNFNAGSGSKAETEAKPTRSQLKALMGILAAVGMAYATAVTALNGTFDLLDRYDPGLGSTGETVETAICPDIGLFDKLDPAPVPIKIVGTTKGLKVLPEPVRGLEPVGGLVNDNKAILLAQAGEFAKVRYWHNGSQKEGWILIYEKSEGPDGAEEICFVERR